jgi:GTP cyclohydrolase IA
MRREKEENMKKGQSTIHRRRIEKLLRRLILEIGENPDREGLIGTPTRMLEMYEELFRGEKITSLADMIFLKSYNKE